MEESVSGDLPLGEPQKICAMLSRRVFGWRRYVPLISALVLIVLIYVMSVALSALGVPSLVTALAALVALVAGLRAIQWLSRKATSQALRERGSAASHVITYSLVPQGLKCASERGENLCYWSAIDEVARTRDHWVFMTLGMGYVLPRRFFNNTLEEQRFVGPDHAASQIT